MKLISKKDALILVISASITLGALMLVMVFWYKACTSTDDVVRYKWLETHRGIIIDDTFYGISCTYNAWVEQNEYIRADIPVIADGCLLTEMELIDDPVY